FLALEPDGLVAPHAAAGERLASPLAVADAMNGQLAVHARQLGLLRPVAHDRIGPAQVPHFAHRLALGVVVGIERAPPAAAPLDREFVVAAANLVFAVDATRARPLGVATLVDIGHRVVAHDVKAVVAATVFPPAGSDDVLLVHYAL